MTTRTTEKWIKYRGIDANATDKIGVRRAFQFLNTYLRQLDSLLTLSNFEEANDIVVGPEGSGVTTVNAIAKWKTADGNELLDSTILVGNTTPNSLGIAADDDVFVLGNGVVTVNGNVLVANSGTIGPIADPDLTTYANNLFTVTGAHSVTGAIDGESLTLASLGETTVKDVFTSALNNPTGFKNITDSTLSFVTGTRTFTITTGGGYDVWTQGKKINIGAGSKSVVITDTNGLHVIYLNSTDMVLTSIAGPSTDQVKDMINGPNIWVASIYWNTNTNELPILGDERHAFMDPQTHELFHFAFGALYESGLTASGYTLDTGSDAALTFEVTNGEIDDEDLHHDIADGATAGYFTMQLNGGDAEIPILYRDDVDGTWKEDAASTLPYKTGGTGRLAYNNDDGDGTFSQIEVTDNKFMSVTLIATNDQQFPIKMIQGQAEYTDKKTAIEEATNEIIGFGNLPSQELVVLYRFVMNTKDTFGGTKKSKIVDVTDFRGQLGVSGGVAALATDHGGLGGLPDDDHSNNAYLPGRIGGQVFIGGTAAGDNLTLQSTSDGTKGNVIVDAELLVNEVVEIVERANNIAQTAGRGQIWIKNDAPNTLWFTDDGGIDRMVAGTGGSTGMLSLDTGGVIVTSVGNPNDVMVWNGNVPTSGIITDGGSTVQMDGELIVNEGAAFNNDQNDHDFDIGANGIATAFHVNGATGFVGLRTQNPLQRLHLRGASAHERVLIQNLQVNSIASVDVQNDARQWHMRVDADDELKFRDLTAGAYRMIIATDGGIFFPALRGVATGSVPLAGATKELYYDTTTKIVYFDA